MKRKPNKPMKSTPLNDILWDKRLNVILYSRSVQSLSEPFTARLMNFDLDPLLINRWVNIPYSDTYWGMKGSTYASIVEYYKENIANERLYPVIISYGKLPIALIEVYHPERSELRSHISGNKVSMGIHTLMGPPRYLIGELPQKVPNISKEAIVTALHFIFSFDYISCIYTEPDINNFHANELAKKIGFQYLKEIQFKDKKANLFVFDRDEFKRKYQVS